MMRSLLLFLLISFVLHEMGPKIHSHGLCTQSCSNISQNSFLFAAATGHKLKINFSVQPRNRFYSQSPQTLEHVDPIEQLRESFQEIIFFPIKLKLSLPGFYHHTSLTSSHYSVVHSRLFYPSLWQRPPPAV